MLQTLEDLLLKLSLLGVQQVLCKPLAENDNSKQQIYLGGSFDVLQMLPFEQVKPYNTGKVPNFKAALHFYWLGDDGKSHPAPHTQLILYPKYPEVRLSGFLRGCTAAPNEFLRPIPQEQRQFNNGPDGRMLLMGVSRDRSVYAFLAPAASAMSRQLQQLISNNTHPKKGVFTVIPATATDTRQQLLNKLKEIHLLGWHPSMRLNSAGVVQPYIAKNGGGYTLEALLGVIPNGRSEPDYLGWEIKGYSSDRITLMTPEPDAGFYGQAGVKAFVQQYGHPTANDTLYFTGLHRVGNRNDNTGLTLILDGYDRVQQKITDVNGALQLMADNGQPAASWTFAKLMDKWSKKHAQAAFVRYSSNKASLPSFHYESPVHLGLGTNFSHFLHALQQGHVVYDPGSKISGASSSAAKVKARSQFRIPFKQLPALYEGFEAEELK